LFGNTNQGDYQVNRQQQAVVITGASSGIGKASAEYLIQKGYRVFACVRSDSDASSLGQAASGEIIPVILDVTQPNSIGMAMETVASRLGKDSLSGLVNNAGIVVGGPLEFLPPEELRRQLEVNVIGQIAVTQAFLPFLRKARGRIINIGSISGRSASPFMGPYSASKFALEALTDALRMELRPWGVTVSIIQPGSIATHIWDKSVSYADRLRQCLPPEAEKLYGRAMDRILDYASRAGQRGLEPRQIAVTIEKILTSKHPATRYLVGTDARIRSSLNLLPDTWQDWLILKRIGLLSHQPG
jgi:NAD(P)-dependent dehydrogenase (short-subunit alcohol dehydrogenase family)